jgi:hypothetical protein
MPKYPIAICNEIAEAFINSHPRGWELVSQSFYIRPEAVGKFFQLDQKLWFKFKKLVQRLDKDVPGTTNFAIDEKALRWLIVNSPVFRDFWIYYRNSNQFVTDELDYLTYVKHEKPVSLPHCETLL